ncbi:hypothetical protein HMPREF0262_00774 [Clostridium sp. ATCC 29733]|nr:hypothetical protein HMPREF0262_00774 [Clostridium sp. ATCC 29733]
MRWQINNFLSEKGEGHQFDDKICSNRKRIVGEIESEGHR